MKVKIEYTVEVDAEFIEAYKLHYGVDEVSRQDIKQHFEDYGHSATADFIHDLNTEREISSFLSGKLGGSIDGARSQD